MGNIRAILCIATALAAQIVACRAAETAENADVKPENSARGNNAATVARRRTQVSRLLEIRQQQAELYAEISAKKISGAELARRLDAMNAKYENLCKEFPDFVEAKILHAAFLHDGGDDDNARELLEDAIKTLSRDDYSKPDLENPTQPAPDEIADSHPLLAVAHRELAEVLAGTGDAKNALPHIEKAAELAPADARTQLRLAEFLLEFRAQIIAEKIAPEQFPDAASIDEQMRNAFRASLAIEPNLETAWRYAQSFLAAENPDWNEVLQAWELAKKIAASDAAQKNSSPEEQKMLAAALELQRARALAELGKIREAEAALAAADEVPELSRPREELTRIIDEKKSAKSAKNKISAKK